MSFIFRMFSVIIIVQLGERGQVLSVIIWGPGGTPTVRSNDMLAVEAV